MGSEKSGDTRVVDLKDEQEALTVIRANHHRSIIPLLVMESEAICLISIIETSLKHHLAHRLLHK